MTLQNQVLKVLLTLVVVQPAELFTIIQLQEIDEDVVFQVILFIHSQKVERLKIVVPIMALSNRFLMVNIDVT